MTDAKGLSSTDLIEWLRDPDLLDGARQHYLDALAERLESCEQGRENDSIDYAQSYQLLTADLERAWAKVKELDSVIANWHLRAEQKDLERARAEVEELKQAGNEMKASYDDVVRDMQAELARMKADPEILVRWQAAEAQRAWEATQS